MMRVRGTDRQTKMNNEWEITTATGTDSCSSAFAVARTTTAAVILMQEEVKRGREQEGWLGERGRAGLLSDRAKGKTGRKPLNRRPRNSGRRRREQ